MLTLNQVRVMQLRIKTDTLRHFGDFRSLRADHFTLLRVVGRNVGTGDVEMFDIDELEEFYVKDDE